VGESVAMVGESVTTVGESVAIMVGESVGESVRDVGESVTAVGDPVTTSTQAEHPQRKRFGTTQSTLSSRKRNG
jgi:hypothetical protein